MTALEVTKAQSPLILVVEDVHETRDGIEKLLKTNGYRISLARDDGDAIQSARIEWPNLILVCTARLPGDVFLKVRRIREGAALGDEVPIVVFCAEDIGEGEEIAIGGNVYLTRPDNFNQLRSLLARLLQIEIPQVPVGTMDR